MQLIPVSNTQNPECDVVIHQAPTQPSFKGGGAHTSIRLMYNPNRLFWAMTSEDNVHTYHYFCCTFSPPPSHWRLDKNISKQRATWVSCCNSILIASPCINSLTFCFVWSTLFPHPGYWTTTYSNSTQFKCSRCDSFSHGTVSAEEDQIPNPSVHWGSHSTHCRNLWCFSGPPKVFSLISKRDGMWVLDWVFIIFWEVWEARCKCGR